MKARNLVSPLVALALLSGCAASGSICLSCDNSDDISGSYSEPAEPQSAPQAAPVLSTAPMMQARVPVAEEPAPGMQAPSRSFVPYSHHKSLSDYVEQMALSLVDTLQPDASELNIAVTSFVDFDDTLESTNQLGNQLAESFIHQMQKFGYTTVDFKTADQIRIGRGGDFSFSRSLENLSQKQMATHVLSGTLIYRPRGVEVNARVVDIDSKKVVASSQKLLPYYIIPDIDLAQAH